MNKRKKDSQSASSHSHQNRKIYTLAGIVIGIGVVTLLWTMYTPYGLDKLAQKFDEAPLPPNSRQLGATYKKQRAANSNTCSNSATKLIETVLSEDEIEAHYKSIPFPTHNSPKDRSIEPVNAFHFFVKLTPNDTRVEQRRAEAAKVYGVDPAQLKENVFEVQVNSKCNIFRSTVPTD